MALENRKKRRSAASFFWYFLLLLLLLGAALLLVPVARDYQQRQAELERSRSELAELKEERANRVAEASALENSPEAIERVARERFKLVKEGETVMLYPVPEKKQKKQ